jgi:hypothetical protein
VFHSLAELGRNLTPLHTQAAHNDTRLDLGLILWVLLYVLHVLVSATVGWVDLQRSGRGRVSSLLNRRELHLNVKVKRMTVKLYIAAYAGLFI